MNLVYITALIVGLSGNTTYMQHKQGFETHKQCEEFISNESAQKYMEKSLYDYFGTQLKEVKGFSCMTQAQAFYNNQKLQQSKPGTDI